MIRSSVVDGALLEPVRDEAHRIDASKVSAFGEKSGSSIGDVVVHSGPASTRLAEQQHAAAFTVGRHVVFNQGRYDPGSPRGRALLAHELTHVQQQRQGGGDLEAGFRMPGSALPRHGGASESHATAAGLGHSSDASVGSTSVGIARQDKTAESTMQGVEMLEFRDADGTVRRVPRAEGEKLIADACRKVIVAADVLSSAAQSGREEHKSYLDQYHGESLWDTFTSSDKFIAAASSIAGDVVPPSLSMWGWALASARRATAAAQQGDLRTAARELRRADEEQADAQRQWRDFREGTIAGAERIVGELRPVAYVGVGMVHGVLGEVAQLADTALWVVDKAVELNGPGLIADGYGALKGVAREHGLVDENNGALSLSGAVHRSLDAIHDEIADPFADPAAFDLWDMSQLGGSLGLQAALATVGATEVKVALKVIGGLGVVKAVTDRIAAHTDKLTGDVDFEALLKDPDFLVALGGAVLYVVGLSKSRVGDKLIKRLLRIAPAALAGTRELVNLGEAYAMPSGTEGERKKRDEAIKVAMLALARVAGEALIASVRDDPEGKQLPKAGPSKSQDASAGNAPAPKTKVLGPPAPKNDGAGMGAPKTSTAADATTQPPAPKNKVLGPPAPKEQAKATAALKATKKSSAQPAAVTKKSENVAATSGETPAAPQQPATKKAATKKAAPTQSATKKPATKKAATKKAASKKAASKKAATESAAKKPQATKPPKQKAPKKEAVKKAGAEAPDETSAVKAEAQVGTPVNKKSPSTGKSSGPKKSAGAKKPPATKGIAKKASAEKAPAKAPAKKAPAKTAPAKPRTSKAEIKAEVAALRKRAAELSKKAVTDPAAVEKIEGLYRGASDEALAQMEPDYLAGRERDRRSARNQEAEDIRSGKKEFPRMPHEATVAVTNNDGSAAYFAPQGPEGTYGPVSPARRDFTSGGTSTPERRKQVGMNRANQESHTEAKAVQLPLKKGQTMTIMGQYDPCSSCRGFMQRKADSSGAKVVYLWMGGQETFVPRVKK